MDKSEIFKIQICTLRGSYKKAYEETQNWQNSKLPLLLYKKIASTNLDKYKRIR